MKNDSLIKKLIKDKNYEIFPSGGIYTKITRTGKVSVTGTFRKLIPQFKNKSVQIKYKGRSLTLSRVIFAMYGSEPLKFMHTIKHLDGNFRNNSIDNLKQMTQAENNMYTFRVLKRAPVFGNTVLDWDTVRLIRAQKRELKLSHNDLSHLYNISKGHVSQIINNKIWVEHETQAATP